MTNTTAPTSLQIVTVNPALAREWLGRNLNNRNIKKAVVAKYAADMAAGRWTFAGDPIRFGVDGSLIDGQHRCHAIAAMADDFAIPMVVITGLEREAQKVMDQGSKRSGSDQLKISGVKHASATAAAARIVLVFDRGAFFRDHHSWQIVASVPAIEEWVNTHPDDVRAIHKITHFARRIDAAPSATTAAGVLIARTAPLDVVLDFFGYVADGGAAKKSAPNVLRNKLSAARRTRVVWSDRDVIANTIRAWNAWIVGRTTTLADPHHTGGGHKGWAEDNFPQIKAVA